MIPETSHTRVLAIVGPTAVGKTALAEDLAVRLHGEIISADSMQVYRGMDIGTAKPAVAERRTRYHLLDVATPGEPYSAALFQRSARAAIEDIAARGSLPLVCGGTGLYVRAALDDWEFPAGDATSAERALIEEHARTLGPAELHALLTRVDAASAALIHPGNTRRVVRALEMHRGGSSYAEQHKGFSTRESIYDARFLGLTLCRDELYRRIDDRVDTMLAGGLLREVEELIGAGYRTALSATQAIGYKEFVPVVEAMLARHTGVPDAQMLAEAVETVKRSTRRYAKRQLTWFRADPRVTWLDVTDLSPVQATDAALELVESWATRR